MKLKLSLLLTLCLLSTAQAIEEEILNGSVIVEIAEESDIDWYGSQGAHQ